MTHNIVTQITHMMIHRTDNSDQHTHHKDRQLIA